MQEPDNLMISDDGSHTVIHPMYQVPYHSRRGAIQESNTVFIDACLETRGNQMQDRGRELRIFEMGFGTGLNAFLTMCWSRNTKQLTSYTGVDAFPLSSETYDQLNYSLLLGYPDEWTFICQSEWNQPHQHGENFTFEKRNVRLEDCLYQEDFDCIFYDAFAPASQPELWDIEAAVRLFSFLRPGGICTTYCAQGQFRRNLQNAGFIVERLPGPAGKREMLRATRPR